VLFLAGSLLHDADHFRRGLDVLTPEVLWIGITVICITLGAVGLTLLEYRHAPLIAIITGFGTAVGVSIVHLLPRWSAFSDPLASSNVDQRTWMAGLLEIGAALGLRLGGCAESVANHEWHTRRPARALSITNDAHFQRWHSVCGIARRADRTPFRPSTDNAGLRE
jgi:hypothetical protein